MKALRYSGVELLIALGLLLVSAPFVEDLPQGDLIEAILVTVTMVSAVLAAGGSRRSLSIAVVLVGPALVAKWLNHLYPDKLHTAAFLLPSTIFFAFVVGRLLRFIVRAPRVDANVLCAGVSGFLLMGLLWAPAYLLVARLNPAAFNMPAGAGTTSVLDPFSAFYFSFITLCTVGYGDITPVSKAARMLAIVEAISGLFYMAILISRLVSVYTSGRNPTITDEKK